jgi:hypothetical protein
MNEFPNANRPPRTGTEGSNVIGSSHPGPAGDDLLKGGSSKPVGANPTSQLDSQAGKMFAQSGVPGQPGAAGARPSATRPAPDGGAGNPDSAGAAYTKAEGARVCGAACADGGPPIGQTLARPRTPVDPTHLAGGAYASPAGVGSPSIGPNVTKSPGRRK